MLHTNCAFLLPHRTYDRRRTSRAFVYIAGRHDELRVGSSIIQEILEREVKKQEDEERRLERAKTETEAHKQKVRHSYYVT